MRKKVAKVSQNKTQSEFNGLRQKGFTLWKLLLEFAVAFDSKEIHHA